MSLVMNSYPLNASGGKHRLGTRPFTHHQKKAAVPQKADPEYVEMLELRSYVLQVQATMMAKLASLENQLKGFAASSAPISVDFSNESKEIEDYVLHWKPQIGPDDLKANVEVYVQI